MKKIFAILLVLFMGVSIASAENEKKEEITLIPEEKMSQEESVLSSDEDNIKENSPTLAPESEEENQEESVNESKADKDEVAKEEESPYKINLEVFVNEVENLIPKNMVFAIYRPEKQFWGAQRIWVTDENKTYDISFDLPEDVLGKTLYIKLFSGAQELKSEGKSYFVEELIPLKTTPYFDEEKILKHTNSFLIEATPVSGERVVAFANEWELYFKNPAKLIDGVCMVPIYEYAQALWMRDNLFYDEESKMVEIYANSHTVRFFLDGHDMYADQDVTYLNTTPVKINGEIYVPFRFLVEGLGGEILAENIDGILNVTANFSYDGLGKNESFVKDIKSRTNYLVWVSKSDFKVTVFEKKGNVWKEVKSFDCSIGAEETPTITGEYDYFSLEEKWWYPTYYVAPIMRFHGSYALHSTLLKHDGTHADARLRKEISHGCVRLAPEDIQWMSEYVPLYSKVYITE